MDGPLALAVSEPDVPHGQVNLPVGQKCFVENRTLDFARQGMRRAVSTQVRSRTQVNMGVVIGAQMIL